MTHGSEEPVEIRPARTTDVDCLSAVLARAFRNDPVHLWLQPGLAEGAERRTRLFRALLRQELRHGLPLTTATLQGAALWEPPRHGRLGVTEQLELALRVRGLLGRRTLLVVRGLSELLRRRPREPHWYLAVLGTDPVHQKLGVGTALMAPPLASCDAEGLPAYLEASRAENIPFYQRHGFAVVGETVLPRGPSVWRMRRPPR